jgi:1-acyl-sn-glycerol-3-phosphate acyltransferase
LSGIYLFFLYGTAKIVLQGDTVLFDIFKRALAGQSRCITAFRHSNGGEPQLLSWFFLFKLKALAAKKGIRFARRPHAVFIYGYEVARWGGWIARLVMPKLGAMPVHHSKMDNKSMDRIYRAIIDGPYPVALAPEGQVSYTTDAVPRLESGVVRIGFRAAQKAKEKSGCPVEILPVSFHFRYGARGKQAIERLLPKIEKISGLSDKSIEKLTFTERLERCRNYILELNETRYQIKPDSSLSFDERLDRVINCALETAERMLGLKSEGELFPRMYRLRQICWDRIVLPGTDSLEKMPRVRRGMLDLRA